MKATEVIQAVIEDMKEGTSVNGKPYWRVVTDKGTMTCWNPEIIRNLNGAIGFSYMLEVSYSPDGKYMNLENVGQQMGQVIANGQQRDKNSLSSINSAGSAKETTMYTSYAKDIFIALYNHPDEVAEPDQLMELSISIVKKAKEAFS